MKENQDRNIQNVYRQIVEISKKYQVKKVVLSGSRARGTNMPKSDIDWRFMDVQILEVCQIV
mgnify:CR=1 FL=1